MPMTLDRPAYPSDLTNAQWELHDRSQLQICYLHKQLTVGTVDTSIHPYKGQLANADASSAPLIWYPMASLPQNIAPYRYKAGKQKRHIVCSSAAPTGAKLLLDYSKLGSCFLVKQY